MDVIGGTNGGKTVVDVDTSVVLTGAAIRLLLVSVIASALHVGFVTIGQDTSDLRSGEKDVGEGRLGTTAGGGDLTLIETLLVRIHELYPDFLDGTVLAKVKFIVSLEKTRDCEHTSANVSDTRDSMVAP